jgi:hypothetical protein
MAMKERHSLFSYPQIKIMAIVINKSIKKQKWQQLTGKSPISTAY